MPHSEHFGSRLAAAGRCLASGVLPLLLAATFSARSGATAVPVQPHVDEYRVKAAILYSLAKFVSWPSDAFPEPTTPFVMCVLGPDPFGPVLDEVLRGHLVSGRAVVARRVTETSVGCHVLFVGESNPKRLAEVVDRLRNSSVLTVGESAAFTENGGMVGLATAGDRVRFEINADAVERARLRVSAQVLALATSVKRSAGRER